MIKSFLISITQGEKLRLRDDVLPLVRRREWIFAGMGKSDIILLAPERNGYIWGAKTDAIDWEDYQRRKNLDYSCRKIL